MLPLPLLFQSQIPLELLRLARANCEDTVYRQILADWVERYGGEEGRLLCRFFRRGAVLRHDPSTWQTLSASEARLAAPFSDLVLGIGDQLVLPLTETQTITMNWVPSGDSWLGGGGGEEGTAHFSLKNGLWCGIYTITQEQWQSVMGNNPSHFEGKPTNPVERVSYDDVQEFLQKLNTAHKPSCFLYRLPSANEWEYILRGGPIPKYQSQYDYYFARSKTDLSAVANNDLTSWQATIRRYPSEGAGMIGDYLGIDHKNTSTVGNYIPNPLGMYDMHGNVWEWTITKGGSSRVRCGGGWNDSRDYCTASIRFYLDPVSRYSNLGFRVLAVSGEG